MFIPNNVKEKERGREKEKENFDESRIVGIHAMGVHHNLSHGSLSGSSLIILCMKGSELRNYKRPYQV